MHLLLLTLALLLTLPESDARAQKKPLNSDALRQIQRGRQLQQQNQHGAALASFIEAFKLTRKPQLLFEIARCHEQQEHPRQAIKYYLLYLEKAPAGGHRSAAELRIVELTMQVNTRGPGQGDEPGEGSDADAPRISSALLVERPGPEKLGWRTTAGTICLVAGGASMIGGVIIGALARTKAREYQMGLDQQAEYHYLQAIDQQGKQLETIQIATLVAGGTLAAAGVGLMIWDRLAAGRASEQRPQLSPVVGPGVVGVSGQVSF